MASRRKAGPVNHMCCLEWLVTEILIQCQLDLSLYACTSTGWDMMIARYIESCFAGKHKISATDVDVAEDNLTVCIVCGKIHIHLFNYQLSDLHSEHSCAQF